MSEYTKPQKSIWKLKDGTIWEGPLAELPKSGASLIAKAGKEYPTEWLKEQGWGKKAKAEKKAPAKKAPVKKDSKAKISIGGKSKGKAAVKTQAKRASKGKAVSASPASTEASSPVRRSGRKRVAA